MTSENRTVVQIDGHSVHIEGNGPRTVVMLHGWPDTHRLWDAQVAALAPHVRCVRFTLPGYDASQARRAHSLDEIVTLLARVVDTVSSGAPVTLLLHDWGAIFGYQYAMLHPQRVDRLIGVDIGDANSDAFLSSLSAKSKLMVAAYQLWLALAWVVGGHVSTAFGDRMTRFMARKMGCPTPPEAIFSQMNYPYLIQWTGRHGSYRGLLPVAPRCPMLFLYGQRKPFMFHSKQWANTLAARRGSEVHGLKAGHWVMLDQAAAFNDHVLGWLQRVEAAPEATAARTGGEGDDQARDTTARDIWTDEERNRAKAGAQKAPRGAPAGLP